MPKRHEPTTARAPDRIAPMLAHAGPYPAREREYLFELKLDGIRAIVHVDRGTVTVHSRNLNDVTAQYPELHALANAHPGRSLVLDGEIVAPGEDGLPSFQRLQNRMGVSSARDAASRSAAYPVVFVAFDLLHLDGEDLTALPVEERRSKLEALGFRGPAWSVAPARVGDGRPLLEAPGWEGIVAKRLGSRYEPGARSRAWIKVKRQRRQELVIGGWSAGQGGRAGRIGALLLGYHRARADGPPAFEYAGSVGTGFTDATLDALRKLLAPDVRDTSPFAGPVDKENATFVEPRRVAEIEFTEWTDEGRLRHPSYKGLRNDKDPRDVTREETG